MAERRASLDEIRARLEKLSKNSAGSPSSLTSSSSPMHQQSVGAVRPKTNSALFSLMQEAVQKAASSQVASPTLPGSPRAISPPRPSQSQTSLSVTTTSPFATPRLTIHLESPESASAHLQVVTLSSPTNASPPSARPIKAPPPLRKSLTASPNSPKSSPSLESPISPTARATPTISSTASLRNILSTSSPSSSTPPLALDPEKEAKRHLMRCHVISEILNTEKSYVEQLQSLIAHYLHPLQSSECRLISQQDVTLMFSNVEIIASVNARFLEQLDQRIQLVTPDSAEEVVVGDLFLNFAPFWKMYTQYVSSQDSALALLQKLESRGGDFVAFLHRAMQSCKGQRLQSYLILPIQRMSVPLDRILLPLLSLCTHRKSVPLDLDTACSLLSCSSTLHQIIRIQSISLLHWSEWIRSLVISMTPYISSSNSTN